MKYSGFVGVIITIPWPVSSQDNAQVCEDTDHGTGGGGHKPKDIRALQENEKLTKENALMRQFSTLLYQKLKEGDIYWANDHELAGNLIIDTDE